MDAFDSSDILRVLRGESIAIKVFLIEVVPEDEKKIKI